MHTGLYIFFCSGSVASTPTSAHIFEIKKVPIAIHGIRLIWEHLNVKDLERLEKDKDDVPHLNHNAKQTGLEPDR